MRETDVLRRMNKPTTFRLDMCGWRGTETRITRRQHSHTWAHVITTWITRWYTCTQTYRRINRVRGKLEPLHHSKTTTRRVVFIESSLISKGSSIPHTHTHTHFQNQTNAATIWNLPENVENRTSSHADHKPCFSKRTPTIDFVNILSIYR